MAALLGTVWELISARISIHTYKHRRLRERERWDGGGERKVNGGSAYKGQDLCATPPSRNELCGDVGRDRAPRHTQIAAREMPLAPPPLDLRARLAGRAGICGQIHQSTNRSRSELFAPWPPAPTPNLHRVCAISRSLQAKIAPNQRQSTTRAGAKREMLHDMCSAVKADLHLQPLKSSQGPLWV